MGAHMRMPLFAFSRRDVLGVLFVAAVLAVLIAGFVVAPTLVWQHGSRNNFGPDWDCQTVPKGEPICIKRAPRKATE